MRDHGSCALSVLRSAASDAARFVVGGGVLGEGGQGAVGPCRVHLRTPTTGRTEHRGSRPRPPGATTGSCSRAARPRPSGKRSRREDAAEAGEVRRVGAGEPVDRLVGVADHAQVGAVAQPGAHQPELRRAGVLELVDEEVTEPPALRGRELGVALEHVGAPDDEVVEVDQPALALLALVVGEDRRHLGRRAGRGAPGQRDRDLVAVGLHQPGLRPLDLGGELGRGQRALAPALGEEPQEDPDLAVEQLGHGAALLVGPAPQLRERDGVERARGDRFPHAEAGEAGAQLTGGLAGEGDREHVRRVDRCPRGTATRSGG